MNLELARRAARSVLGYRSPLYRLAARALTQYEILRCEGWNTSRLLRRMMAASGGAEVALTLRNLRYPILVRVGTDDLSAVIDNAVREEYGQLASNLAPDVIVDAGAYIGDTSAYFLSRFPASRVIALEPNADSYSLALRNLLPYGERVSLLKAALWTEITTVRIGGMQTSAAIGSQGTEIPTETVASLMSKFNLNHIDLLKLDIEGAESQVLPAGVGKWLDRVGTICLETHSSAIENHLIPLLTGCGFTCARFRNVWYCTKHQRTDR